MCVVTQRECKPHNWDYLGIHREYTPLKGVRDLNTSGYPIPRQCLIHPAPFRECSRYFKSTFIFDKKRCAAQPTPAIAQLVEHLTVEWCRHQVVPGSIPGRRTFLSRCLSKRYVWEGRALA